MPLAHCEMCGLKSLLCFLFRLSAKVHPGGSGDSSLLTPCHALRETLTESWLLAVAQNWGNEVGDSICLSYK